jgi:hypothetical protein
MPLTNKDVRSAGLSYLLYRRPAIIIEREDLLRSNNDLQIPSHVLNGAYELWFEDAVRNAAVYVPTGSDLSAYRRERRLYLENVAHVSHLARVTQNGQDVPFAVYGPELKFLREGRHELVVARDYSLELRFDTGPVPVFELHIETLRSLEAATVLLTLWDAKRAPVHEERIGLQAREWSGLHVVLPAPIVASAATLTISGPPDRAIKVLVGDLRVQAQPPPLERYIADRVVRTPPSATSTKPVGRDYGATRAMQSLTMAAIARSPSAVK